MKRTIFLIVGQNFDYDLKLTGMNIRDVIEYVITHDLKHEHGIEIWQSDSGHHAANWGREVYRVDENGVLSIYDHNVDSSD